MTAPAVQYFFETPLIAQTLPAFDVDAATAAALALAERYSVDVSQPATPRFTWSAEVRVATIAPGETERLVTSPGNFWVAACCIDPGDGAGGLMIEDPRIATVAAGVHGLDVIAGSPVTAVAPATGEMTLFQAFVRHGVTNPGRLAQRWILIALRPKPI